jgi:orotidine-5'-phosphate decarboxylase
MTPVGGAGGAVSYFEKLEGAVMRNGSRLCVGLDPDPERVPGRDLAHFLTEIIAATRDLVCCYKPNLAFFEALGPNGNVVLRAVLDAIPSEIPILADAKRGDVGNTAEAYARALFEAWGFDAVTVNPYGGRDTLDPFLSYVDRGVYVWCRSSNPGAADFQDMNVLDQSGAVRPLFEIVAERVRDWNVHGNAALVAGATYPEQIRRLRSLCPDLPFLLPGVGAQGAAIEDAVRSAEFAGGGGFIVNASRGVLYASTGPDFADAARREAAMLCHAIDDAQHAGARR